MAGAISRAILKRTKCEKCLELLSAGNLEVGTTNVENIEARQEFMSKLSRGCLLKPSDVVYITCIHAFVFYRSITILNTDCKKGHKFSLYVPHLANILFNVMAKNHVSEMNNKIHAAKNAI